MSWDLRRHWSHARVDALSPPPPMPLNSVRTSSKCCRAHCAGGVNPLPTKSCWVQKPSDLLPFSPQLLLNSKQKDPLLQALNTTEFADWLEIFELYRLKTRAAGSESVQQHAHYEKHRKSRHKQLPGLSKRVGTEFKNCPSEVRRKLPA